MVLAMLFGFFSYNIYTTPGLGFVWLYTVVMVVLMITVAVGCSADSYEEWSFNRKLSARFGR